MENVYSVVLECQYEPDPIRDIERPITNIYLCHTDRSTLRGHGR